MSASHRLTPTPVPDDHCVSELACDTIWSRRHGTSRQSICSFRIFGRFGLRRTLSVCYATLSGNATAPCPLAVANAESSQAFPPIGVLGTDMKVRGLSFLTACVACLACSPLTRYSTKNYTPGSPVTATVGAPLISVEHGTKEGDLFVSREAKQLIYSGKAGTIVRFSYREFAGDRLSDGGTANLYARPAFTQDVQYDLADGNEIAFQDMRLNILKASTSNITAEVLQELGSQNRSTEAPRLKAGAVCWNNNGVCEDGLWCNLGRCTR